MRLPITTLTCDLYCNISSIYAELCCSMAYGSDTRVTVTHDTENAQPLFIFPHRSTCIKIMQNIKLYTLSGRVRRCKTYQCWNI